MMGQYTNEEVVNQLQQSSLTVEGSVEDWRRRREGIDVAGRGGLVVVAHCCRCRGCECSRGMQNRSRWVGGGFI